MSATASEIEKFLDGPLLTWVRIMIYLSFL